LVQSGFVVTFRRNTGKPGKLADAELHFTDGPLKGYRLIGFCLWEHRQQSISCTFPMRPYSVGNKSRSQELLSLTGRGPDHLRDHIVTEWHKFHAAHPLHPQGGRP
jgi:hypothetical protein